MKWKAKNDLCGVPGKGYIKAEDFSQEDENALIKRAKSRGIDVNVFMMGAGFVPVGGSQLELPVDDEHPEESEEPKEETPKKRTRRTKAEIEADKK
jgi:hypothetical protein